MGLPVRKAAGRGRPHPGRVVRVHAVEVEAHVNPRGTAGRALDGLFHDRAHAPLVDVPHGKGADPRSLDVGPPWWGFGTWIPRSGPTSRLRGSAPLPCGTSTSGACARAV